MTEFTKPLALALALALAGAATAQETPAPAPATEPAAPAEGDAATASGLSMGQELNADGQPAQAPADGVGQPYVAATHGDWEQKCIKTADGKDPCQIYQLLKDAEGNSVAEVSMFALPAGQEAAAGATIIVPLETLLTAQLTIKVDSGAAKRYPFTWCSPIGCVARVGFTAAEVAGFKKGNKATLTIVPVVAPDQKVDLDMSLSGFTAGYDAVSAHNAANAN